MKKNKYLKTALCIGVGVIMLTGAVFANYDNAGGYSSCKNALKKLLFDENYSASYTAEMTFDGETYAYFESQQEYNGGGNPSMYTRIYDRSDNSEYTTEQYVQDGFSIRKYSSGVDGYEPSAGGYLSEAYNERTSIISGMFGSDGLDTAQKFVNFAETIADTLVGDLKNSFVLVSDEGGLSTYNITLTREQMPSYVSSGMALMSSIMRHDATSYDYDNESPGVMFTGSEDAYVKDAVLTVVIDKDGNLNSVDGNINFVGYDMQGNDHAMGIRITASLDGFGTTVIEPISQEEIYKMEDLRGPVRATEEVIGDADAETGIYVY